MANNISERLEAARAKLAALQPQVSDEERELSRLEEELLFAELQKKAAANVRLGRLLLKGGGQIIFRQMTGPELTSVKNAKDGPETELAWMAAMRKCIVHPDLATYNAMADAFPTLDQEVSRALSDHNKAQREALPGK